MENYVKGKVILMTGAGSETGFGRITASKLCKMGGKLVVSDVDEAALNETVELVKAEGGEIVGLVGDASVYADNEKMIKLAVDTFGRADVFIANAGTMPLTPWDEHKKALPAWEKCIDLNLKGTMYGIAASYDRMIEQGSGQFISISSIYANFPVYGSGVYQATKIGVRYLANSLRQEAMGKIKVTIINPTGVASTNLGKTVIDARGVKGILGCNSHLHPERKALKADGKAPEGHDDPNSILNWSINANEIADSIVHVINQPLGVSIAEITVRATNELYVL